jgi:hypothetical protein
MAQAQQAGQPSRHQTKPYKKNRFAHTANTKYGMGDNYGSGIKAKIGKMREDSMGMMSLTPKKLKTPPRSVA